MILAKLDPYREVANRDRFKLPINQNISFFIKIIDDSIKFFSDEINNNNDNNNKQKMISNIQNLINEINSKNHLFKKPVDPNEYEKFQK